MSSPFFNVEYDHLGNPFYIIPAGTTLYRGESSINQSIYHLEYAGFPIFFGFDKENMEKNYGITYQFTTIKNMRCIAIDLLNKSSPFYIQSPLEIQKILIENYGIVTKKRLSESKQDKTLASYICTLGIDGYAIHSMDTLFDLFHAEIAICNITDKINPDGIRVTSPETADKLKQERVLIENQKKRAISKRRSHLFDDDDDHDENNNPNPFSYNSPPSSPIKINKQLSFQTPPKGGSKKKRYHRKSSNKNKKRRKTYKK